MKELVYKFEKSGTRICALNTVLCSLTKEQKKNKSENKNKRILIYFNILFYYSFNIILILAFNINLSAMNCDGHNLNYMKLEP